MNTNSKFKKIVVLLACAWALFSLNALQAAVVHVDVNTSSLGSNPNGPFYLDFQMNYGGAGIGNSALVNNFTFGGGASSGSAVVGVGNPTGNLNSSFNLSANGSNPFNDIYQAFTPGVTVGFDLTLTANPSGATPDAFLFAILDHTTGQIPTSDPNGGLSLLEVDIDSLGHTVVKPYHGVNDALLGDYSAVTLAVVPEPATAAAGVFALGFVCLTFFRSRKGSTQSS